MDGPRSPVAVAVFVDGAVRIRIYEGEGLKFEISLSWRRALVIANDLVWMALAAERASGGDPLLLQASYEQGITDHGGSRNSSECTSVPVLYGEARWGVGIKIG
jgi:hypothetical protein